METITKKEIFSWIKTIAIAIILLFLIRTFLLTAITVNGESMSPTFEDRDKVLVNRVSEIQDLDIVVFDAPDADKLYIKRVIGLPGDSVEVKDDVLYINGKVIDEPYIEENKEAFPSVNLTENFTLENLTQKTRVPEGMLFVMGDNRMYSKDSRTFGFIKEDSLVGEVVLRYYPFNKIGIENIGTCNIFARTEK